MACLKVFRMLVPTMFLSAFLLTACGGDDEEGTTPLQAFSDRVGEIICNAYVDCGCMPDTKLADCQKAISDTFPMVGELALVAIPGLGFDNDAAQLCLDDLETLVATCPVMAAIADLSNLPASCGTIVGNTPQFTFAYGLQQDGDYCSIDYECATGLGCDILSGTCEPLIPLGGDCEYRTVNCAAGSHCVNDAGDYSCVAHLNEGDNCNTAEVPGADCGQDLFCENDTVAATYICTAPHAIGDDCTYGSCIAAAYCDSTDTCAAKKAGGVACTETICLWDGDEAEECLSGEYHEGATADYCTAATFCNTFTVAGNIFN